jgi:hypothetical protein
VWPVPVVSSASRMSPGLIVKVSPLAVLNSNVPDRVRTNWRVGASCAAGGSRRSHRALNRAIEMAIDDEFAALPALARGFDLIVGASVQAGAPSVAELLGIPYRYVVYCTALVPSPQGCYKNCAASSTSSSTPTLQGTGRPSNGARKNRTKLYEGQRAAVARQASA